MTVLSKPQQRLLASLWAWGGDFAPDLEDDLGISGAAFWSVFNVLRREGLITEGSLDTWPLTDKGRQALKESLQ